MEAGKEKGERVISQRVKARGKRFPKRRRRPADSFPRTGAASGELPAHTDMTSLSRSAASSGAPTLGPSATQALQDVAASITNTLKSLKTLRRVASCQMPKKGLIDGGATACLRQTRSELEWESSNPIRMRLAVGDSEGIRQTPSGFLVTCQPVEPIVALHELIQLGYRMTYPKPVGKVRISLWSWISRQVAVRCPERWPWT